MKIDFNQIILILMLAFTSSVVFAQVSNVYTTLVYGACAMCQDRIEQAALSTIGVKKAVWNLDSKELSVEVDPQLFDETNLHLSITASGHDTEQFDANDEIYDTLPGCCLYRSNDNPHYQEIEHGTSLPAKVKRIRGTVYEQDENGTLTALMGANLFWKGSTRGSSTDLDGKFTLERRNENDHMLVVSYVGYDNDTVQVHYPIIDIVLSNSINLQAVEVVHERKSTEISMVSAIKIQQINEKELLKAACCNLSESFETNPSIDVSFTDAVTGTRKIEMLGLAGPYVQITRENMPDVRALSALYGLTFTPGPWIEGIQMNMGTGSVANGFESITGQINVELRKPENSEQFYLNLYANEGGRLEGNLNMAHRFNENISTGLLLHANQRNNRSDRNEDGFLDMPLGEQLIAINRWKFIFDNNMRMQMGVKATISDKISGQYHFDPNDHEGSAAVWGANINTNRFEGWAKIGRVFPEKPYKSIGLQLSGISHDQEACFGLRSYNAKHSNFYMNLMYQSIIDNTNHQFRTGISYLHDVIDESIDEMEFNRKESVPGVYFEYTFTPNEKLTLVTGIRADHHSDFDYFVTPRLNFRYALNDRTIFRAAVGRGQRTASIFAENIGLFASSRKIRIESNNAQTPYGLDQEIAWNYGVNLTKAFKFLADEAVFSLDLYHTRFDKQIVVDLEDVRSARFYNLEGESFSNSIQAQLDLALLNNLEVRLAYRFNDVMTDYQSGELRKPLSARHRAFLNTAYCTKNEWKFDFTLSWQGEKRIPDTSGNPEGFRMDPSSPGFFLTNAHISKNWKRLELYIGAENLFNYTQENPIISAANPFDEKFDSSLIWGPVFGRNVYVGLRYRIP